MNRYVFALLIFFFVLVQLAIRFTESDIQLAPAIPTDGNLTPDGRDYMPPWRH